MSTSKKFDLWRDFAAGVYLYEAPSSPRFLLFGWSSNFISSESGQIQSVKGTVPRDFLLQVSFHESGFLQAPEYPIRAISIFFSQKFAEIFAAQGAPPVSLTTVANEKNLQSEKF